MIKYWRLFYVVLLLIQYSISQDPFKILCYYSDWRLQWHTTYRLLPKNIDPMLCTHILYAFAMPDLDGGIVPVDFLENLTEGGSEEFIKLKEKNPNIKLMLSIGGWNEGSVRFSRIAADPDKRRWFAEYSIQFIRGINFDGLDMNWQWPGLREGSNSADRVNYVSLMQDIRYYFSQEDKEEGREPLILSIVLPPSLEVASKGFSIPEIANEVDFMILHTMDYHDSNEPLVDHPSPLYDIPLSYFNNKLTVDNTVKEYLKLNMNPKALNLGIALYGRSFILESPVYSGLGSRSDDEGVPGYATNTPGILSYYEICRHIQQDGWEKEHPNSTAMGPIAHRDRNWVGYDDEDFIRKKVNYAFEKGLGGVSLWTIDMDDYNGTCNKDFPLTRAARDTAKSTPLSNRSNMNQSPLLLNKDFIKNSTLLPNSSSLYAGPSIKPNPSSTDIIQYTRPSNYPTPPIFNRTFSNAPPFFSPYSPIVRKPSNNEVLTHHNHYKLVTNRTFIFKNMRLKYNKNHY